MLQLTRKWFLSKARSGGKCHPPINISSCTKEPLTPPPPDPPSSHKDTAWRFWGFPEIITLILGHGSSSSRFPPCQHKSARPHQIHSPAPERLCRMCWNHLILLGLALFPFLQRKMTPTFVPEGRRLCPLTTCRLRNHTVTCTPLSTWPGLSPKGWRLHLSGVKKEKKLCFLYILGHFLPIIVSRRDFCQVLD